ncbi:fumarylacetoacetate hydrolase family protein [Salicibibacter cibarius]|uniref:Fumarylacetoacetate hydrolase family protein n=1 Tax=Salicibibacter cibarius TaxID=2743000 RepID=A0A7T7CDW3_9BACI|nr:fumarylacetoacetate hydrolase family protein [Salicibibacter cibarius]QQK78439.1 fumarylacetoacetate hydrolase family protein [Salicibibacter cibarius]
MKTVNFYKNDRIMLGVKTEIGILDVEAAANELMITNKSDIPLSIDELLMNREIGQQALMSLVDQALEKNIQSFYSEALLSYGPSVTNPEKIICVGLNYKKHAQESNMSVPKEPLLFSKFNNTLSGHKNKIKLPANSTQVDYEAELAIIMGKQAKNIKKEEALSYVFGFSVSNDLSARDLQFRSSQWLLGKTCDAFTPLGPYLVSHDEIENPNRLSIRSIVNGEVRQDSNTSDMVFNCSEIVSYISEYMTLYPGDVILTGTPAGVIAGYPEDSRVWLKDGDEITIEIENVGQLYNRII